MGSRARTIAEHFPMLSLQACGVLCLVVQGIQNSGIVVMSKVLKSWEWPYFRMMALSNYITSLGIMLGLYVFKGDPISGYCLRVAPSGDWTLSAGWPVILNEGTLRSSQRWR